MRAFVALELPEAHLDALARLQAGLEAGRKVPEENLHMTLAFLGDVPEMALRDLDAALAGIRAEPVPLEIRGLDLLTGQGGPVLVARASGEGLQALHDKVMQAARGAGLNLPRVRFQPHVTLSRLGKSPTAQVQKRLGEFLALNAMTSLPPETADEIALYRSHLRNEAPPIYEMLALYPLAL